MARWLLLALAACAATPHRALVFETTAGVVRCELDGGAPRATAMVTGLARGTEPFRDVRTGELVRRPFYDGLAFFRRWPGILVQTGCPVGDGSGTPGYRIPLEARPGDAARLARPGALLLAHYQPPPDRVDQHPPEHPIGSQLVIALDDMSHVAGTVTVLGRCRDLRVVDRISRTSGSVVHLRVE